MIWSEIHLVCDTYLLRYRRGPAAGPLCDRCLFYHTAVVAPGGGSGEFRHTTFVESRLSFGCGGTDGVGVLSGGLCAGAVDLSSASFSVRAT